MSKKRKINSVQLLEAWKNWEQAFANPTLYEFEDFLDPVRQTDIRFLLYDNGLFGVEAFEAECEVTDQVGRRIDALCGPHFYAFLKANRSRVERCKTAWGRRNSKLTWKWQNKFLSIQARVLNAAEKSK